MAAAAATAALRAHLVGGRLNDWETYHERIACLLRPGMTVLEVGCGKGDIEPFPWNHYPGVRLIGLDPDPAARANPHVDEFIELGAAAEWPVEGGAADLVLARYVIEHVAQPWTFLSNVRRVLKPGGRFLFLAPNLLHPAILLSHLLPVSVKRAVLGVTIGADDDDVFPTFYRMNSARRLRALADKHGFTVERLLTKEFAPCTYCDRFWPGFLAFYSYFAAVTQTGLDRYLGATILGQFRSPQAAPLLRNVGARHGVPAARPPRDVRSYRATAPPIATSLSTTRATSPRPHCPSTPRQRPSDPTRDSGRGRRPSARTL